MRPCVRCDLMALVVRVLDPLHVLGVVDTAVCDLQILGGVTESFDFHHALTIITVCA